MIIENRASPPVTNYHERGWAIDRAPVGKDVQLLWDNEVVYELSRELARKCGLAGIQGHHDNIQAKHIDLPESNYGEGVTNSVGASARIGLSFEMKPEDLAGELEGVLKGHEQTYFVAGVKYGIDPSLLAAISILETGNGSSHAAKQFNNVGGMMASNSPGVRGFLKFSSLDEGIEAMARNLREKYLNEGLDTVKKIGAKYAPVGRKVTNDPQGGNAKWPVEVSAIYKRLTSKGILGTPDQSVSIQFHSGEM